MATDCGKVKKKPAARSGGRKSLVLVLGDQLAPAIAALRAAPAGAIVLICEVAAEATYVRHHKKKIAFLFSAMRHFAEELRAAGRTVDYVRLDDPDPPATMTEAVRAALKRHGAGRLYATLPGEWRLLREMEGWPLALDADVRLFEDDRFICARGEFAAWAEGRRSLRMEYFYREMRRKTGLLMDGDRPAGARWNYDAENRKPASPDLFMAGPLRFAQDAITRDVLELVGARFADHFGDLEPFWFAVTRADAEKAFEHFLRESLPRFGDNQDAMLRGQDFLYHSICSLYLNCGLLDPLAMCRAAEREYLEGRAPLNAVEGFVRQILGWREFVRGIYFLSDESYTRQNALSATRALPAFYWTGDTDMECLRRCIGQTKREAYAHHIQRLMVTGLFALLAGVDPHQVHEWYLIVYADAYEWVEAPNVIGMSQFADGGYLASKPYAASGAYIDRMSDYCAGCAYDVKQKAGPRACPFNYLYWDFLARNETKLQGNPRIGPVYRAYAKFSAERKDEIARDAARFLDSLT
ncbi:MAG: cryptochrome/photolyase family protein [Beijerinckiaceae bacterium]